jgi:hypothetical protein
LSLELAMNRHRVQTLLGGCLLAGVLLPLPSTGAEQANAIVDALQMPAWIERQGVRHALVPGTILANQDKLVTGADARVRIQLADGSVLALGDNSEMRLNALGVREKPVFTAAIDVPHGSLRFTTGDLLPAAPGAGDQSAFWHAHRRGTGNRPVGQRRRRRRPRLPA